MTVPSCGTSSSTRGPVRPGVPAASSSTPHQRQSVRAFPENLVPIRGRQTADTCRLPFNIRSRAGTPSGTLQDNALPAVTRHHPAQHRRDRAQSRSIRSDVPEPIQCQPATDMAGSWMDEIRIALDTRSDRHLPSLATRRRGGRQGSGKRPSISTRNPVKMRATRRRQRASGRCGLGLALPNRPPSVLADSPRRGHPGRYHIGTGLHDGLPVGFTMVAVDGGASLRESSPSPDRRYAITGTLTSAAS